MRTMTRRPSRSGMIRPQTSIVNGITSCMQIAREIDQTYFPVGQDTFLCDTKLSGAPIPFELPLTRSVRGPCLGGEHPVIVELGGV
jgi:hypothetical protein